MTKTTSIFLSVILLTAGLAAVMDFAPDAFALKAKGITNTQYGSATKTIVCGDRLCSEVGGYKQPAQPVITTSQSSIQTISDVNLLISTDMGKPVLYLINTNTDDMITVELGDDPKWPGGAPFHSLVTPDASKVYLTLMSSDTDPLSIVAISLSDINWQKNTVFTTCNIFKFPDQL